MTRFSLCLMTSCMVLAVAGCQSTATIEAKDTHAKVSGTNGLQPLSRYPLVIRTFKAVEDGKKAEVKGLACTLTSAQLRAKVTTPQRVMIPAFAAGKRFRNGGQPGPVTVTCRGAGLSGRKTHNAYQPGAGGGYTSTVQTQNGSTQSTSIIGMDLGLSSSFPWGFNKFDILVD